MGVDGLLVFDAAEAGSDKHATVKLRAGTYEVHVHRRAGYGGDFTAAKLARLSVTPNGAPGTTRS